MSTKGRYCQNHFFIFQKQNLDYFSEEQNTIFYQDIETMKVIYQLPGKVEYET